MNRISKIKKTLIIVLCLSILFGAINRATAENTVTDTQRDTIYKLTSIFENLTTNLQYTYIENIGDGRGYTFGFPGFCTGTYDGTIFLKRYEELNPDNILVKYIPVFEYIDSLPHPGGLCDVTDGLDDFPDDLKLCKDDPLFKQAQHEIVDELYWNPSQDMGKEIGAVYPITYGELYDTYINHGEDGAKDIIDQTNASVGKISEGADEKVWLNEFLDIRLGILEADETWQYAVDRVHVYQTLLNTDENLYLERPISLTCYGVSFTIRPDATPTPTPPQSSSDASNPQDISSPETSNSNSNTLFLSIALLTVLLSGLLILNKRKI